MILKDRIDPCDVPGKSRSCIARRRERNLACLTPAGAKAGKNRDVTGITPA
ncbi:MAG TPA: hypothetical protein PKZ65_05470 [Methanoregulaceae archaeon]|nr:hypothetical protein [Methanoregulaceae archaeon]